MGACCCAEKTFVTNVIGSGSDKANKTWISLYRRFNGKNAKYQYKCSIRSCSSNGCHGGHVFVNDGTIQYIIPLCPKHNNPHNKSKMLLKSRVKLAPVENLRRLN